MNETSASPSATLLHQDRPLRLLTRFEVRERLGNISDDKLYSLIKDRALNPPCKIGTSSRWLESDLDSFIATLAEARQAPSPPAGIRRHHEKLAVERKRRGVEPEEKAKPTKVVL